MGESELEWGKILQTWCQSNVFLNLSNGQMKNVHSDDSHSQDYKYSCYLKPGHGPMGLSEWRWLEGGTQILEYRYYKEENHCYLTSMWERSESQTFRSDFWAEYSIIMLIIFSFINRNAFLLYTYHCAKHLRWSSDQTKSFRQLVLEKRRDIKPINNELVKTRAKYYRLLLFF